MKRGHAVTKQQALWRAKVVGHVRTHPHSTAHEVAAFFPGMPVARAHALLMSAYGHGELTRVRKHGDSAWAYSVPVETEGSTPITEQEPEPRQQHEPDKPQGIPLSAVYRQLDDYVSDADPPYDVEAALGRLAERMHAGQVNDEREGAPDD